MEHWYSLSPHLARLSSVCSSIVEDALCYPDGLWSLLPICAFKLVISQLDDQNTVLDALRGRNISSDTTYTSSIPMQPHTAIVAAVNTTRRFQHLGLG